MKKFKNALSGLLIIGMLTLVVALTATTSNFECILQNVAYATPNEVLPPQHVAN